MAPALEIDNLSCRLGGGRVEALRGVSLTVQAGEMVFVAGRSGAGKSTLARCLFGLIPRVFPGRVSGRIRLGGTDLSALAPWEVAQRLGLAFQRPSSQLLTETVEQEVAFGPENLGLSAGEIADRIDASLEAVALSALRARRNRTLSLGQKQKLVLAAALALRPSVLVLDEPASCLDEPAAVGVMEVLARLARQAGTAVLVLEHRARHVLQYASRLVVLRDGMVAYDGDASALEDDAFCTRLGLRRAAAGGGGAPPARAAQRSDASQSRIARVEDLCFAYEPDRSVLSHVDLEVLPASATLVSGPNGSGKTTLLRIVAGLLRPRSGRVHLADPPARGQGSGLGGGVAFVGQQPAYQFRHSNAEAELRSRQERFDDDFAEDLLARLDLLGLRGRHPLSLSEGEKARLAIASGLACRAQLLVLDEPSVGFDGYHLDGLFAALARYMDAGGGVLAASNDPDFLQGLPACAHHLALTADGVPAGEPRRS